MILNIKRVTLRSHYKISVDFDKICMFCSKCCIHSDKCVVVVIKIKFVNSGNISDICDKFNFTTNYTYFTTNDKHFIKTHTTIIIFDTFDGTVSPRDLSISDIKIAGRWLLNTKKILHSEL